MKNSLLIVPFLVLFGATPASAVGLSAPLGLTTQYPNLNTQGLKINYSVGLGTISLEAGEQTTAQLSLSKGDIGMLYGPDAFTYRLSGNVKDLQTIDFTASTIDNKVNLTGTVAAFGIGTNVLEFLVDVASTGTVDFGKKLGIIVSNMTDSSVQADSFVVPVPSSVWLFATGLMVLVARRTMTVV